MDYDFWRKQKAGEPLFPDFGWKKPENKLRAGNVLIIGGNKVGFTAVAMAHKTAEEAGAGKVKVLLPDIVKKTLRTPPPDAVFLPSNISGGFSREGLTEARASVDWANTVIFIGDSGQNSETALFLEDILFGIGAEKKVVIARDAVDLLKNDGEQLMNRPNTLLVVGFPQLQKLFQSVYYPKVLTFSQNLAQVVENLHKFTSTYPSTILLFHKDHLFVAHGGQVVTQEFTNPTAMWTGKVASRAGAFWLWSDDALEAVTASLVV